MAERILSGERPERVTSDEGAGNAEKCAESTFRDLYRQHERAVRRAEQPGDLPREYLSAAAHDKLPTQERAADSGGGTGTVSREELIFVEAKAWGRAQNDVWTRGQESSRVELPAREALGVDAAARLAESLRGAEGFKAGGPATVLVEFGRVGDHSEWRALKTSYGVGDHWVELSNLERASSEVGQPYDAKLADACVATTVDLTSEDRRSIEHYTGHGYLDLNRSLREGAMSPEKTARAEALSHAISKLPAYEGEVYRGANIGPQVAERYRVGVVVTEDAFTSTSRSLPFEGKNTYWIIQSKKGRDIEAVSLVRSEEEVLFDRGSKFRVTDNFPLGGDRYIVMEEVE